MARRTVGAWAGMMRALLVAAVLALAPAWAMPSAMAADTITLKSGRVVEGKIVKEHEGYIWVRVTIGELTRDEVFSPAQIASITRDDGKAKDAAKEAEKKDAAVSASATPGEGAAMADEPAAPAGPPRAAIISVGGGMETDLVGLYVTARQLRSLIPLLKQEGVTVVIFRINSGGGLGSEVEPLSDVIHNEYKKDFRVAAWIESAISAAAMTAHCMPDIYFMSRGNYGAATAFRPDGKGGGIAVKGRELQGLLRLMERISDRGGHARQIMRSMQIDEPLSATELPNGEMEWRNDTEGKMLVNPAGRVLTLTAKDAVKYKFARGIADTHQELAKLMGMEDVVWVGEMVPGVPYPVSLAERETRKFRALTLENEKRLREYFVIYTRSIMAAGQASTMQTLGEHVATARAQFDKIVRMVRDNPAYSDLIFGIPYEKWPEWVKEAEDNFKRFARRP